MRLNKNLSALVLTVVFIYFSGCFYSATAGSTNDNHQSVRCEVDYQKQAREYPERAGELMVRLSQDYLEELVPIAFEKVVNLKVRILVEDEEAYFYQGEYGEIEGVSVFVDLESPLTNQESQELADFIVRHVNGLKHDNLEITNKEAETVFP